jgi:hypothetical protein
MLKLVPRVVSQAEKKKVSPLPPSTISLAVLRLVNALSSGYTDPAKRGKNLNQG